MLFRVPIYIPQNKSGYTARPLFHPAPYRTDDNLNRLLTKLSRDIVQNLERLGKLSRHDDSAEWAFSPRIVLNVAEDALERVIEAGYDPALGARAMKRAVERELTQPAASRLAEPRGSHDRDRAGRATSAGGERAVARLGRSDSGRPAALGRRADQ